MNNDIDKVEVHKTIQNFRVAKQVHMYVKNGTDKFDCEID